MQDFTIVIPAKNEEKGLAKILPDLRERFPETDIIVVDDGSVDKTASVATSMGAKVVHHPYSKGNGASIKTGAREVKTEFIVFMDADGQHRPEDISRLYEKILQGYDMVVGSRTGLQSQASVARGGANALYNMLASTVVGHKVEDLTSGFRIVKTSFFKDFLYMLPNGFSYPTTITMAFFRAGYSVSYIDIIAEKRLGKSHIKMFRDGIRFLLIIFKIATLYSPLKLFFPLSVLVFSTGFAYYIYTFYAINRFTNMAMTLMLSGLIIFLMGLISEQITSLMYRKD